MDIIEKNTSRLAEWTSEKDKGQIDAVNKGFARAKGEILARINTDDLYYHPQVVWQTLEAF